MELLDPWALGLLVLAGVLFLLPRIRRPRPRMLVSNAYLWRETAQATPRLLVRVSRHRLLLLQALLIALIVLAVARPVLVGRVHEVAVVFDVSASMGAQSGGGTRADEARTRVREIVATLPRNTRVRLIAAGPAPRDLGSVAAHGGALEDLLDGLTPGGGRAVLDAAVAMARAALPSASIYVVTDAPASETGAVADRRATWIPVGAPAENLAVTALAARRLPSSALDTQVFVEIRNFGRTPRDVPVVLDLDGRTIVEETLQVPAGGHRIIVGELSEPGGTVTAAIDARDALAIDDRRTTVLPRAGRIPVLLITEGSFFLERALAVHPAVDLRIRRPGGVESIESDGAVVVCDGCAELPGEGAVLLIPAGRTAGARAPLVRAPLKHPVTAGVTLEHLRAAPLATMPRLPNSEVVVRAAGLPAVVVSESARQRAVAIGFDLDQSDLPLDPAFPVLLANVLAWLAEGSAGPAGVVAGTPVSLPLGRGGTEGLRVIGPDGQRRPLTPAGDRATVTATEVPGIYRYGDGAAFAVHPDTDAESDLSSPPPVMMPAPGTAAVDAPDRTPLFPLVVLGALAVLLTEWRAYCRAPSAR